MTYLLISLPFLIVGLAVAAWRRQYVVTAVVAVVLIVLTIVFDNLMIWAELVGYGDEQRLGLHIGLVPAEDLFYALFVALIVPAVWPHRGRPANEDA